MVEIYDLYVPKLYVDFFSVIVLSVTASSAAPSHGHTADSLRVSVRGRGR